MSTSAYLAKKASRHYSRAIRGKFVMTYRRSFLITTLLLAASTYPIHAIYAQQSVDQEARKEKHTFIMDAMNEIETSLAAEARESAKRGEFSSIAPPPAIVPFGDWDYYYLKDGELNWKPNAGQVFRPVTVPVGFVSDLTSVPRLLWSALPRQGRYAYAAVIHDYLYWTQDRTRQEADQILLIAMEDSNVDANLARTIHSAVRAAGGAPWNSNARLKAAGEKRILKVFPTDFTTREPLHRCRRMIDTACSVQHRSW